MSTVASNRTQRVTSLSFATVVFGFVIAAFCLTMLAPLAMCIAIVFLFAGPHNYFEARYFLTRLPARMGRLKTFFVLSTAGVIGLSVMLPLTARLPGWFGWPNQTGLWLIGLWNTLLVLWCTSLASMRSCQPPKKEWDYAWPVGLGVIGLTWLQPILLPVVLVFMHPVMGLWVLDREILKSRPEISSGYRLCLMVVPMLVGAIWWFGPQSLDTQLFAIPVELERQIAQHSGASLLAFLKPGKLIATHAFLELLHYGVWIVAVPAVSGRLFRENFRGIPLMRRSENARRTIVVLLGVGAVIALVLWVGFAVDYSTTRDLYFTVATLHVLAEVPFLLRLL